MNISFPKSWASGNPGIYSLHFGVSLLDFVAAYSFLGDVPVQNIAVEFVVLKLVFHHYFCFLYFNIEMISIVRMELVSWFN